LQRAAHIASNVTRIALLDPKSKFHYRGSESQLVLIDLEE
jgi:hypothetical protein